MVTNDISKIKQRTKMLLQWLSFDDDPIVTQRENAYYINITLDSPGILIGKSGEVLDSLQHLIRLLLQNDNLEENYFRIIVDINGYRSKKVSFIEKVAREVAYKVRETKEEVVLEPMNAFERRIVHSIVSKIDGAVTESIYDGREKRIKIKPE